MFGWLFFMRFLYLTIAIINVAVGGLGSDGGGFGGCGLAWVMVKAASVV